LHYFFGLGAHRCPLPPATGDMIIVRYADDSVVGFEHQAEAKRFLEDLRKRMGAFSLLLHPDKTRLIEFGRHAAVRREKQGLGKPETFTFLGFTLICGTSRKGYFQIRRKTRGDRMRATLKRVKEELRQRMHEPIPEQGNWLAQVVTGFFAYHAVPTNRQALSAFRDAVVAHWQRTLSRRSQNGHLSWARMTQIAAAWLPAARVLHPWPCQRFDVKHPRREPSARIGPARFCAGGAQ
jgi:RNA-directed DNA polymerase